MSVTVYKPTGIPVFPPHDRPSGDCVLARVLRDDSWRKNPDWPPGFAGGIAHRLDNSTSGALLLADNPSELSAIRQAFTGKRLTKTYLLLAARNPPWHHNTCAAPLAHDRRHNRRMVVKRGVNTPHRGRWREAETRFERVQGNLWRATICTGVMHQIRVHAAFVGIPLLGDALYGGGPTPPDAPPGLVFYLHHVGLKGGGWSTEPVPPPEWMVVDPRL